MGDLPQPGPFPRNRLQYGGNYGIFKAYVRAVKDVSLASPLNLYSDNGGRGAVGAYIRMEHELQSVLTPRPVRKRLVWWVGMGLLFCLLLWLCWLFPIMGDDWFREELGRKLTGPGDLMQTVIHGWETYNGRILGNILAYSAGGRKVLREVMRSAFTLGTIYITARHMGFRSFWGVLVTTAALLALPLEMFRQIYPWAAGFFNYVPPVLMVLTAFWLLRPVFDGGLIRESVPRGAAVFLLGFGAQLFMENNTLYALWAGLVLVVWYDLREKRLSPTALAFFLGTAAGAALLFLSPAYGLVMQDEGGYATGLTGGLSGLLATLRANQEEVLRCLIAGCPVFYVSLTVLALVAFARARRRWFDILAAGVLVLGSVYFAFFRGAVNWMWTTALVVVLWGFALLLACWRWLPQGGGRNRAIFFLVSAGVAAFPLLFVQPIGPRCLYLSYVCLLITAGGFLTILPLEKVPVPAAAAASCLLAGVVLGHCLWIFTPIHTLEVERDAILVEAMDRGETQVTLPAYPHGEYMWDGDSNKVQSRYYYETPGDLIVTYVPAAEWKADRG